MDHPHEQLKLLRKLHRNLEYKWLLRSWDVFANLGNTNLFQRHTSVQLQLLFFVLKKKGRERKTQKNVLANLICYLYFHV